jgi:S-adenosyl methyltransferase
MTAAPHLPRGAVPGPPAPPGVDPSKPSPARLYGYCLGGHNNFEVDRKAAEARRRSVPALGDAAWAISTRWGWRDR